MTLALVPRATAETARALRQDGFLRTVTRAVRTARIFGLANAVRRAENAAGQLTWYRLELNGTRPRTLPTGMELRRCQTADIPLFAQLEPIVSRDAKRRMEAGGVLWLVLAEGRPVFGCWIFTERSPAGQAKDGWLELPARTAQIEDSYAAKTERGRGIGPAAVSMIVHALADEGFTSLVTKVKDGNTAARGAMEKLGFVSIPPDDPFAVDLARQLRAEDSA